MSGILNPGSSHRGEAPVIVIGAGFAGASAALTLADAGRPVLLLEAAKAPGGRARSFPDPRSGRELDWGPHLFMKANPALREFLGRIGASASLRFEPSLDLTYRLADGAARGGVRNERLSFPARGGAPASLLALLRWRGPRLAARLSIARGLRRVLKEGPPAVESPAAESKNAGETVEQMLDRLGQGASEREWFWEPFSGAVLNMPAGEGSGELLRRVMCEAFGPGLAGASLGAPAEALGPFWADRALDAIRRAGGEVKMAAPVRRIRIEGGAVRGVTLSGGESIEASVVIAAVPPPALLRLLPAEAFGGKSPWRDLGRLRSASIATAYLWLDHPCPGPAYEALVAERWEWLFRPGAGGLKAGDLRTGEKEPDAPVAFLCGGADSLASAPRSEIESAAREAAGRLLPDFGLRRVLVVRERAATWANGAGEQAHRTAAETPVDGLILAGDWTATGLPATCEGAVRSGFRAAEAAQDPKGG
ncbi:MAG: FAD-dependent oxidoreductase [Nitrospinota bacterium]|nr:FAD-dependent oxidoreductase [Nitrospinota bacterium]